jgi:hypothetical protein
MALNNNPTDASGFRFRVRKAPGAPHASVEAFKASPGFATVTNAIAGKPETVGTVHVSYKLYEGSVWVRYDFDDENARLAFRQYILDSNIDLGETPGRLGMDSETFPSYGFLA